MNRNTVFSYLSMTQLMPNFSKQSDMLIFKGPSMFCPICEKEGHLKANCPDDQLPALEDLPPMTKTHLQLLTSVVKQVPGVYKT